jgi:nesprin-1
LFQQSLLDRVPAGESQAEDLQEQQRKLLHFCDDALATSIRMEHAAITQRISNLQAGLETWKGFLKKVASLTATFDDQVNHIETVFKEIHVAVAEPDALPLSHTGMQNRLENLRVSFFTTLLTTTNFCMVLACVIVQRTLI